MRSSRAISESCKVVGTATLANLWIRADGKLCLNYGNSWSGGSTTSASQPRWWPEADTRYSPGAVNSRTYLSSTIAWYAENRDRLIGRVDWLSTGRPTVAAQTQR